MDVPEDMVFNDEDRCTLFRLPHEAYPRYAYFRDKLEDFHPRLTKTIGNLPDGLRNNDDLPSLNKRIRSVISSCNLEIAVIGPGNTKITLQQLLKDHTEYEEEREILHLTDTEGWNDSEAKMKPLIVIYTMGSLDISKFEVSNGPQWLKNRFQCCNPIFFIRDRKNDKKDNILVHLQDILQDEFDTYNMRKTVIFQSEQDALSTALSEILEEVCVMAFVHIETYIFSVTKVSNLRGIISITLDELFRDFRMSIQRMLEDKDLFEICLQKANRVGESVTSHFGLCLADRVAILLASKLVPIFKIPGPAIHSFLYASKLREETKDILLNLRNLDLESHHKDDQPKPKQDTTLQESPEERVKGLDGKLSQSQLKATQRVSQQQMPNLDPFVNEFEKLKKPITLRIRAIKSAQPTIQTLKRLHFELEGILKETSMHLCTDSELSEEWDSIHLSTNALSSKDPYERWKQALFKKLKDVQLKTGTVFGKFCVFIDAPKMTDSEEKIKRKIEKVLSNFPYEYEVRIIDEPRCFANGHEAQNPQQNESAVFKMGMSCRSQEIAKIGTIGLFLKERSEPSNLFFVTSAHLVPSRGKEVQVFTREHNWVNLGESKVVIPTHVNLIDITAVEVLEQMRPLCSLEIEDKQRSRVVRAEVFDISREKLITLEGHEVYKKGAQTGVTSGIVSSIYAPSHLYVSPKPGLGSSFAEKGDSGAIVRFDTPNRETRLLSMIMGQDCGTTKQVLDSETMNLSLADIGEGADGGNGQSPDDQLIFTTLLCKGLEELKNRNLDLKV